MWSVIHFDWTGHDIFFTMITSPNFHFDAPSFLTKNGIINIVRQLGPNAKNLARYLWGWPGLLVVCGAGPRSQRAPLAIFQSEASLATNGNYQST